MQTAPTQLQDAFEKARRVSVELMMSGREHTVPEIRGAVDHLLNYPQNMDASGPTGYLTYSLDLVEQMERQAAQALPELVPFIRELRSAIAGENR